MRVDLEIRLQVVIWLVNLPDSNRRQWRWTTLLGEIPDTTAARRVKAAIHWDCKNKTIILTFMWLQWLEKYLFCRNVTWRVVSPEKRGWQFVLRALSGNRKESKLVHMKCTAYQNQTCTISKCKHVNKRAKRSQYKWNEDVKMFHLYFRSSHFQSMPKTKEPMPGTKVSFLSRVEMNSITWSALDVWVLIAQLVEHCCAKAQRMGSISVEATKSFFVLHWQLLKLRLQLRRSRLHFTFISAVNIVQSKQSIPLQNWFNRNARRIQRERKTSSIRTQNAYVPPLCMV